MAAVASTRGPQKSLAQVRVRDLSFKSFVYAGWKEAVEGNEGVELIVSGAC